MLFSCHRATAWGTKMTEHKGTERDHTQADPTPDRHFSTCGHWAWLEGLQTHHRWTQLIKSQV